MLVLRTLVLSVFMLALGFSTGCGGRTSSPPMGSLFGKVSIKGEKVTGGNLIFRKDGKEAANLKINGDGTYQGVVPLGDFQVGVDTETVKQIAEQFAKTQKPEAVFDPSKMKDASKFKDQISKNFNKPDVLDVKYVPIPGKYRDPGQSGFSVTVQQGKQEKNFEIP